jgi:hypothetical protein
VSRDRCCDGFAHIQCFFLTHRSSLFDRWRNGGFLSGAYDDPKVLEILLQDKAFGGDPKKLQGYYAYIGPESYSNWEQVYFDDHVDELMEIKSKYDPNGVFDKPMQILGSNVDAAPSDKGKKGFGNVPHCPVHGRYTESTVLFCNFTALSCTVQEAWFESIL